MTAAMSAKTLSSYKICRVCLKPAVIRIAGEQQNAIILEGKHEDGETHTWLLYKSMELNTRKTGKPNRIKCPRCGKIGTVNQYRPDARNPLKTYYVIKHEKIDGLWGGKMRRRRRCFIRNKKLMEIIDKKLKRYVKPEPEQS